MRPQQTIWTIATRWMIATGVLLMGAFPAAAQVASLDSLPKAIQEEISRVCLPVQFREGARSYRNCVQAEINLSSNDSASELGSLSFDDKYAVQQACAKAGGQSSLNYQSCVLGQITELKAMAQPALDKISEDEQYVVQQSCFEAQSKQGAARYRQCLNSEIQNLLSIPAADTSKLDMLKKNALQLRCSSNTSNAVQYRECVAAEFESIVGFAPSFLPIGVTTAQANSQATVSKSVAQKRSSKSLPQRSGNKPIPARLLHRRHRLPSQGQEWPCLET